MAAEHGWDEIITTDDTERGGKMATFVLSMLDNTALVADSIGTYVWALRWKMKLSHQAGADVVVVRLISLAHLVWLVPEVVVRGPLGGAALSLGVDRRRRRHAIRV